MKFTFATIEVECDEGTGDPDKDAAVARSLNRVFSQYWLEDTDHTDGIVVELDDARFVVRNRLFQS
jgi:hypothetical protein